MSQMLQHEGVLHADTDQECGRAYDDVLQMHECQMCESVGRSVREGCMADANTDGGRASFVYLLFCTTCISILTLIYSNVSGYCSRCGAEAVLLLRYSSALDPRVPAGAVDAVHVDRQR